MGNQPQAAKQWQNGARDNYSGVNMYEMSETLPSDQRDAGNGNPAYQQDTRPHTVSNCNLSNSSLKF